MGDQVHRPNFSQVFPQDLFNGFGPIKIGLAIPKLYILTQIHEQIIFFPLSIVAQCNFIPHILRLTCGQILHGIQLFLLRKTRKLQHLSFIYIKLYIFSVGGATCAQLLQPCPGFGTCYMCFPNYIIWFAKWKMILYHVILAILFSFSVCLVKFQKKEIYSVQSDLFSYI